MMSEPLPSHQTATITRWATRDGAVVADTGTAHPGVFVYLRELDQRRIDDPAALIAALGAAERVVREHNAPAPLTKDEEIAFRKHWDATVVPSPGTGGIRHPSSAPSIIGTRPRPERPST